MSNQYKLTMPDIGEGIAEVEVLEWNVKVGDHVNEDDAICCVSTDKANVEIPSPVDGIVSWIGCEAGTVMQVGAELIHFAVTENVAAQENNPRTEPTPELVAELTTASALQTSGSSHSNHITSSNKVIASPAVRRRAHLQGIDLNQITGTGPKGRIIHADLDKQNKLVTPEQALNQPEVEAIKVTGIRKHIGMRMQDTVSRIPHFSYVEAIDVTELEKLRTQLNAQRDADQPKLTLLPFIIKALAKAVQHYPQMNANYDDVEQVFYQYRPVHVGVATQTEQGLLVPVLQNAHQLSLWQSAEQIKQLSDNAKAKKLLPKQLRGSTITISSLGPYGGIATTPIINSPEVCILGINKIQTQGVWQHNQFVPRQMMNISASFDHRMIDGWEATQFIHKIKDLLERPAMLFIEQ
ncbi:dihydrolipoamide acetyltransferase family protein [Paraferrimonas sp. SM1919]|uniref:dihydrolipoamide acetyltransferase family protein n=1 Tax=Paraferrimonas sp. SM1919 TaxID=2662263 RepID=UPI0013D7FBC7|nr:dihydrolipoamide acetyltransferase family protein [Paraferrimonas sp. SM1919]